MEGFLDAFADERDRLLDAVQRLERSWALFTAGADPDGPPNESLLSADLRAAHAALAHRRFAVGLFGLVKRGKSTLLNALVGCEVSSTGVNPETAVPVYVDHGEVATAEVRFVSGKSRQLEVAEAVRFTSQDRNPGNEHGVLFVRQRVPSAVLQHGVRVIDTPGLDDADIGDGYGRRTMQELEAVDAAIVVFQAPPTVGLTEMRFLREIVAGDLDNLVLVCNMYPEHYHDPVTRSDVLTYIRRKVADHVPDRTFDLVAVCAQEAEQAARTGDRVGFERAGGAAVLELIEHRILTRARKDLFAAAEMCLQAAATAISDQVRRHRSLLADPEALHARRIEAERGANQVERNLRATIALHLAAAGAEVAHARTALQTELASLRHRVEAASDTRAVQHALRSLRRGVELAAADAARAVGAAAQAAVEAIQQDLAEAAGAGLAAPQASVDVATAAGSLDLRNESAAADRALVRSLGGALAGGAAGGVGLVAVGALLGPIGLIAGALAGWRLGGGRTEADRLRASALERSETLAADVLTAFDMAAQATLESVRTSAQRRLRGYVHDLLQPIDKVEHVVEDDAARALELARCEDAVAAIESALADARSVANQVAAV